MLNVLYCKLTFKNVIAINFFGVDVFLYVEAEQYILNVTADRV